MEKKLPDFNSISPIQRDRLEEKNQVNSKIRQNNPSSQTANLNLKLPSKNKSDTKLQPKATVQHKNSITPNSSQQSPKKPVKKPAKYLVYSLEEILENYEDYLNNL